MKMVMLMPPPMCLVLNSLYDRKSGPCRQKASECDERVLHSLCHSTFSPAASALDCRKTLLIVVKKMNIASVSCEVSNNANDAHHDDGADHDDDAADDSIFQPSFLCCKYSSS